MGPGRIGAAILFPQTAGWDLQGGSALGWEVGEGGCITGVRRERVFQPARLQEKPSKGSEQEVWELRCSGVTFPRNCCSSLTGDSADTSRCCREGAPCSWGNAAAKGARVLKESPSCSALLNYCSFFFCRNSLKPALRASVLVSCDSLHTDWAVA